MNSEALFVWVHLPGQEEPVVAGRFTLAQTAAEKIGRFVYGQSYLARKEAIPLDPVVLPLKKGEFSFTALSGFPGVLLDACPDRWGIKVIDRLAGKREYPQGYLLLNDPGRAGNLAFSLSAKDAPLEMSSREFSLPELQAAAEAVEAGKPVDPELLRALHPGTGGARPKCNVIEGNGIWIAKFSSLKDPNISVPRLEHATMQMARLCGINAAETRIITIDGKDVCLVRRFDRHLEEGKVFRRGFLSARSVFFADPGFAAVGTCSYGRLSRWIPRYGCSPECRRELFRRMVFNCVVRNDDDHELNHGLVHVKGDVYDLAPAYDIVPNLQLHRVHHHALLIGETAAGTIENLVGNAEAFNVSREEAAAIIKDIESKARENWQDVFYEAGFGDEDLRKIEHVFRRLPEEDHSTLDPPGRL